MEVDPHSARPVTALADCRYGRMLYLTADTVIGRALPEYGEFAESENRVMSQFIRPGDTVIDVGANIGTVTLAMARAVGADGTVHAYEPQRFVFTILCANLALNDILNVYPYRAALGRAPGRIAVPAIAPDTARNFGSVSLGKGEPVRLATIDGLGLQRCRLIKIDVEGMEYDVFLGAQATIEHCQPVLYFEAKKTAATQTCIAWLQERGYRLYWHFAGFFDRDNVRGRKDDIFRSAGDINALAVPAAIESGLHLPRIEGPDSDWQADYTNWSRQGNAR